VVKACPECVLERIVAQTNLAVLRLRQKKYAEADSLFSEALAMEEKYYSRPGPDMAATMRALAVVKERQRRFEDAERLQRRANMITGYR
jgi:tetratricopeptide (TPR) repeat protein